MNKSEPDSEVINLSVELSKNITETVSSSIGLFIDESTEIDKTAALIMYLQSLGDRVAATGVLIIGLG